MASVNIQTVLGELGLSDGEIGVYQALLKLGSVPVSKIKEETRLHRTTIYDFLEKLLNKGLISYVVKNNVNYYKASHPEKLMEFLKEKEDHLSQVMPELIKLANLPKEEVKIEVYKGAEGLKTVMLDAIRTAVRHNDRVRGIGIDDGLFKKALPVFLEQYQRLQMENNVHEDVLTKRDAEYYFHTKNTHYRFMPKDMFSPVSTLFYGDKIQIVLWEPSLTTIYIQNQKLADAYKKHFQTLWDRESMIFRGEDEVKAIFDEIVVSLKRGEEYVAFGVPPMSDQWDDFFHEFVHRLDKKGVREKVILDERATKLIDMCKKYASIQMKTLSQEFMSPAEVDIYGDKIALVLWTKEPQAFVIENKDIAQSFKQYFELIWGIANSVD